MQVLLNTDSHIRGSAQLTQEVESLLEGKLERFTSRITRVEVHLNDENGDKGGDDDYRCAMEARLAGLAPITVTHKGGSKDEALEGAAEKLTTTISRTLDKLDDPRGRTSFAGEPE